MEDNLWQYECNYIITITTIIISNIIIITFFLEYWGLNSGPHACYTDAQPLESLHQPSLSLLSNIVHT
jgi:hypothetical protein